ncbi:hypothetical protein DFS33DRAFT_532544 [Desarmillaria ectypa]|nr:hypothetical protein DFS33DRAFT_532544 [Desarmillaria ectypa]
MDYLVLILTIVHIAVIAQPIAKGGGKSSSGKSSEKSSGTKSVSINSGTSSSTTTTIYYGNHSRCYRDYLHTVEIRCPHHRLSTGAIVGIAAGSVVAVLLILTYYFREKITRFIKRRRRVTIPEDSAMEPLTKADS